MYTPLYIKTNYSLLSSLIKIDDLIDFSKKNNIKSLAICDSNMFGVMEFYNKCINNGIKPIIGLELFVDEDTILVYASNNDGYKNLLKLSTIQSERKVVIEDIKKYSNGLIIVLYKSITLFNELKDLDIYIGFNDKNEEKEYLNVTNKLVYISKTLYLDRKDSDYLKYLYMIRDSKTIADDVKYDVNGYEFKVNPMEYSSSEGLYNSNKIMESCNVDIIDDSLKLPKYKIEQDMSEYEYLTELCKKGLNKRLNGNITNNYADRLKYELDIIEKMGFCNYFLVVYDFIRFAKKSKILVGPGRGSAAGSLVSYCLGITDIDPIKYDLLFERFLNPERITMPDIDTDFPDTRRDEVINYVVDKYGSKKVSGIITFGTLSAKQVIRDVSRVLNVPIREVDLINKKIPTFTKNKLKDFYNNDINFKNIIDSDDKLKLMFRVASYIEGFPRHTSIHAAGIVMSNMDLDNIVPLVKDENMYMSGYTAEYLENLGLLKMDFLGLKNLTTITNIIEDIKKNENVELDFNIIPLDDMDAIKIFSDANTLGIFQFESVGMRNFISRLKPKNFDDIFAAIALFRPGPAENIDSYIRRNHGEEKVEYIDPSLEDVLKSTYGIIIYQEQIMQIASKFAGYTLGEADILRRAMSKKKMDVLKQEEEKFINMSMNNGHDYVISKKIFDLILKFANYGFNKSHSVAYSIIAYKMAYLKAKYPKYFYSNLLSSVIGSEYKTKEYIDELKKMGINILKPDINKSSNKYLVERNGIRFPLSNIKNLGVVSVNDILKSRDKEYEDIFDFVSRTKLNRNVLEALIDADCFSCFSFNQATLYHNLDSIINYSDLTKDLDPSLVMKPNMEIVDEYDKDILVQKEKEAFGFYISNHPVTKYKLSIPNVVDASNISNYFNKEIILVLIVDRIKNIVTKSNTNMAFIDASDEYSTISLTMFPKLYEENSFIKNGDLIKVVGRVEKRYDKYQVVIQSLELLNNSYKNK